MAQLPSIEETSPTEDDSTVKVNPNILVELDAVYVSAVLALGMPCSPLQRALRLPRFFYLVYRKQAYSAQFERLYELESKLALEKLTSQRMVEDRDAEQKAAAIGEIATK